MNKIKSALTGSDACAGALAEVARELGAHMVPYTGRLWPLLLRELRHDSAANRRNAAFAAGVLVQAVPGAAAPHLPTLLQVPSLPSQESGICALIKSGCIAGTCLLVDDKALMVVF